MEILDVSKWKKDSEKQLSGTRTKYWIIDPKYSQHYMFKIPRENTGEAWAEKVAAELGKLFGLSMMDVQLACRKNVIGIIAKNFTVSTEEFFEGGDLISAIVEDFDRYKLDNYTFENITQALTDFGLDDQFVIIPIFDALIGNQDRHCDNWGIIVSKSGSYRLAPIYDNGTSLGFQLKEERIKLMFKDKNMFKAYNNRSYSLIGIGDKKKPKYTELIPVIRSRYPSKIKKIANYISGLNNGMIIKILNIIPDSIMSDIYKEWVLKLLLYRRDWLIKILDGSE
ncbi:HipA domain-containing protein [Caldifermentibacillus hisashii]|jgi:hypothetical protein|uniref:HipA domain-containing protein n=1 Tax=Caldifermentibacillus hisashii TaxID=996558 RepID=UPI0031B7762B